MLTPEQKENILAIMAGKRKDIVYRDWTRRVRSRVSELTIAGDKVLNDQIRMLRMRLTDLEYIYDDRITESSLRTIARDNDCHKSAICRLEKEHLTGLSEYLHKKYSW